MMRLEKAWREWLPPALSLAALILVWQGVVGALRVPHWILPSPVQIVTAGVANWRLLTWHTTQTLLETLVGVVLAVVAGAGLALAIDLSPGLRRALYPLLVTSQTIPIMALAPLLVIWFGYGLASKAAVVALVCFFPVTVATADGLRGADPDLLALLRSMGASRRQVLFKVRLPGALPGFFSGLKIAVTYSVIGAIIGEWVGAGRGLGVLPPLGLHAGDDLVQLRLERAARWPDRRALAPHRDHRYSDAAALHAALAPFLLVRNRRGLWLSLGLVALDFGALVPLWFLGARWLRPPAVVVVAPSRALPRRQLVACGEAVVEAAVRSGRRVAIVCSADLGHGHRADGPYGYSPASATHDRAFCRAIRENALHRLLHWREDWIERAMPDGFWSTLVLHGALRASPLQPELVSYEAPTYFGMACAAFEPPVKA